MPDYGVSKEQVAAAAAILRPNGYDVPAATLERAIAAALDAIPAERKVQVHVSPPEPEVRVVGVPMERPMRERPLW